MRRRRHDLVQPTDIAFLLIIFFLLLAGSNISRSIDLKTGMSTTAQTRQVELTLHADGTLSTGEGQITATQLESELTPQDTLHIFIEPETTWQKVVDILSIAEKTKGVSLEELP